jgi:hypothetical protein
MDFRLGKVIVQPVVSAVAANSQVTSVLSPLSAIVRIFHFPATSASESLAAGAGAVSTAGAAAAVLSAAGCFSVLAQPMRRTAAQQ